MSPKGGIGKTTTSDSIAYMLGEEQEKRVLVLDGDPQGDTSKTFGVYEPDGIGMSELLEKHECVGGTYKTGDLIRPTEYSHVDIIPANGYLMKTDMNLLLKSEDNQVTRFPIWGDRHSIGAGTGRHRLPGKNEIQQVL